MKYRKLTENGDYAFGRGGADMHADTPEAVGQAVLTRLRLFAACSASTRRTRMTPSFASGYWIRKA